MTITQQPPAMHTANNPVIIKCNRGAGTETDIILTIQPGTSTDFEMEDPFDIVKREYFRLIATFDIQSILKAIMESYRGVNILLSSTGILYSYYHFLDYSVYTGDEQTFAYHATAFNSVAQIGESSSRLLMSGKFATSAQKLIKYTGYPLEVAAISNGASKTIKYSGGTNIIIPSFIKHFVIPIADNVSSVEFANQGNPTAVMQIITASCIPDNPFYVRWLNREGGYDHWMFSYRQFFTRGVSGQQTFTPQMHNQQTATSTEKLYSITPEEFVRIGAQDLSAQEYETLSRMVYSPVIEWWDESAQNYKELIIQSGNSERDNRNALNEIEFTFKLPQPQLQF